MSIVDDVKDIKRVYINVDSGILELYSQWGARSIREQQQFCARIKWDALIYLTSLALAHPSPLLSTKVSAFTLSTSHIFITPHPIRARVNFPSIGQTGIYTRTYIIVHAASEIWARASGDRVDWCFNWKSLTFASLPFYENWRRMCYPHRLYILSFCILLYIRRSNKSFDFYAI